MKLSIEQKKIIDNCFPFAGKVIPVTESQRQCMFTAVEAVLEEQAGTLTDAAEPIEFRDWWISQGKFIDPDTEDVPWFDKREALCEAAYEAGQSSVKFAEAYLAQRTPEPAPAHDYTSTACQHELHERCRKNCKFCLATCKCECHGKSAPTPHPEDCLCVACEDKALPAPDGLELPGGGDAMSLISKLKNAIDPPILCLACGSKLKWGTQVGQPSPPSCRNDKCPRYGVCTAVWKEKP